MSEEKTPPTKDQPAPEATPASARVAAPPAEDATLTSLEDLDKVIAEQDPEFKDQIESLSGDRAAADLNIELIDLDRVLEEQKAQSLLSKTKRFIQRVRGIVTSLRSVLMIFLKEELPLLIKKVIAAVKGGLAAFKEILRQFSYKPKKFKIAVGLFATLCLAAASFMYILISRSLISEEDHLFLRSLQEWADQDLSFEPLTEQEPFYDSVRVAQNILAVPKLVANLKPSRASTENPMIAVEFYIEGNSPDVVIEMKDREVEMRDLFLRTLEEHTYDDLDSPKGKEHLVDKLSRRLNHVVTKGRIRKIYYKTIVMKP